MRLALVRQRYTPFGGAERFVERALDALAHLGVELALITRRWPRNADRRVSPVIVNPPYVGRTLRDSGFARAACAAIARMPDTLVQSHERIACCDIYRAGDGVHAEWVEERLRDTAAWARAAFALGPYHRYMLAAERRLYASPRLRQVICNSRMVQTEIHERFGLPRERLPIIYNAIDTSVFHPGLKAHRALVRARHGIGNDACVFLLVGSAYARKGVARVLEALATVPAPAHFIVVGRDRRPAKYAALARHFGVANRVTFAGPQIDPRPYYGAADVFVLPTLYDPFPNAILEAMACALPVVTSDRCGAAELVAAHAAGSVCSARDVGAIAAAMRALVPRETRARAAANAVEAVQPLTPDAMAQRLIALYESLLPAPA
ncbi:MAG: glycosyltransferase family 4 protein [Casimicrobiaceae bacterium]